MPSSSQRGSLTLYYIFTFSMRILLLFILNLCIPLLAYARGFPCCSRAAPSPFACITLNYECFTRVIKTEYRCFCDELLNFCERCVLCTRLGPWSSFTCQASERLQNSRWLGHNSCKAIYYSIKSLYSLSLLK